MKTNFSLRSILSIACVSALLASSAFAQVEQLPFATGVDGGTYNTTFEQWKKACPSFGLAVGQISEGTPPKLRNSTGTRERAWVAGWACRRIAAGVGR